MPDDRTLLALLLSPLIGLITAVAGWIAGTRKRRLSEAGQGIANDSAAAGAVRAAMEAMVSQGEQLVAARAEIGVLRDEVREAQVDVRWAKDEATSAKSATLRCEAERKLDLAVFHEALSVRDTTIAEQGVRIVNLETLAQHVHPKETA